MIEEKEIQTEEADSWFNQYDKPKDDFPKVPIFEMKLMPGKLTRSEKIVFVSEGKKAKTRFGDTIIFNIKNLNIDKVWFIKTTQYSLLNPIAVERKKGSIIGRTATVERVGVGQKDTKWSLVFDD